MRITLNGQEHDVPPNHTLKALLTDLGLDGKPCAAEVNQNVVPRKEHPTRVLHAGDTVELVTLVGGG